MKGSEDEALDGGLSFFPSIPWRWFLPLTAFLALAIVIMTWPWARTFASGVLTHWDPPFHAWKLEFAARQILDGRLFPVDGNTNMYYPNSGAFYYEALHWPQALFATPLLFLGMGPVLTYHVTLIFFWALSGACLWALLRALGVSPLAAVLGALIFTIMPYRMSYMVEFNMQLCFGIPLFLFFFVRFFQRPGVFYACGVAVSWWLQATSELYQAFFLLLLFPFPVLAVMSGRLRLLRSFHDFWKPAAIAALLGGGLSLIWLMPYTVLLGSKTLSRGLGEIRGHALEPLSYFVPFHGFFSFFGWIKAATDEMSVYPSLMVIVLTLIFLGGALSSMRRENIPMIERILRLARATALVLFFAITIICYLFPSASQYKFIEVYSWIPIFICLNSIPIVIYEGIRNRRGALMEGMFSAVLFAFFMSLGPQLRITSAGLKVSNSLFVWMYKHLEALSGFRVMSRFAFFVLLWMVIASAIALDHLLKEKRKNRRTAVIAFLLVLGVAFIYESVPRKKHDIMPLPCPLESKVLDNLDLRENPYVLAILPLGIRDEDSQHMLQVSRYNRPSVYAWGGTYPPYTKSVEKALNYSTSTDPAHEVAGLLRQLWPDCLILEDKLFSRRPAHHTNCVKSFTVKRPVNYVEHFKDEAAVEDEDERFVLLRLKPDETPATEHIRLVRRDMLIQNPHVSFTAFAPDADSPYSIWLDFNGRNVGSWEISREPRSFDVVIPEELGIIPLPNRFSFRSNNNEAFVLREFRMKPAAKGMTPVRTDTGNYQSWHSLFIEPPAGSVPLDAAFRGGLQIAAMDKPVATAQTGTVFNIRYYVTLPKSSLWLKKYSLTTGFTREGMVIFEFGGGFADQVDPYTFATEPQGLVHKIDMPVPVPMDFAPGEKFGLALTVRDDKGKRMSGHDSKGQKFRRLHLPFTITITDD